MKKKIVAILVAFVLVLSLAACGAGEETTFTGMVVSVEGTVISVVEMDSSSMGEMNFSDGEMPQMPEGMEGIQGFGSFDPESFDGTLPEGESFPQRGDGERPQMPEGMEDFDPESFDGTMPEGMEGFQGFGGFDPESFDGTMPEDMTLPEGGMSNFENFASDGETREFDIGNAHISVEIDGGKASGSMDDITAGTFVTVTLNGKGEVTNVLVSSRTGFGGGRGSAN